MLTKKGFTIIELLVAMGLFIVLMGIAAGSFIKTMRTQRAIVALMAANDNASLTLEQMAREIRTGFNFIKISNQLQFDNAYGAAVLYRLNAGSIERGVINPATGLPDYKRITADNVLINNLRFELLGQNLGDGYPPRITIVISATGTDSSIQNISTNIQTTISSRFLDS